MLVAFAGLPSSGKSSTARELGVILQAESFLEPEESSWPNLVRERSTIGKFTALTWFRTVRVPDLFAAKAVSDRGGVAIVDSYYDKLVSLYLGEECFSWLIPRTDPYFDTAMAMAKTDYCHLPVADILVFLKIEEDTWRSFMKIRGRAFDDSAGLIRFFKMQDHIENACQTVAQEQGTQLIVIDQHWSSPKDTAIHIANQLRELL